MHRVKGLEFPHMIVAGVKEGEVPLKLPPDAFADEAARKAFEEQERRLLYVAATRARDDLVVTGYGKASPLMKREQVEDKRAGER
jgi:superfamily I DNA/RNA helicase